MEPLVREILRTRCGCRVRIVEYAPGHRLGRHAHARGSLTLVLRGDLCERSDSSEHRASALSVVTKPSGLLHEDAFGPEGATTLQVLLPVDAPAPADPIAPRWDHAGPACRALLRLAALAASEVGPAREEPRAPGLVADALEALRDGPPHVATPTWLLAVREALARGPLPVSALAERFGVHRVHLARAFRAHFGLGPAAWRGRMRVHRAAARLAGGRDGLADVALGAGFSDQAHMSRELRAALGVTPRQLRGLVRAAAAPAA